MKFKPYFFILSALLLAITACKKNGENPKTDVYVVGFTTGANLNPIATYWKNGIAVRLGDTGANAYSVAYAIAVKGKDVYIAGYTSNGYGLATPTYWKNGMTVTISDGSTYAIASCIAVTDSGVYLGGIRGNGVPAYWKNGTPMGMSSVSAGSSVYGMAVSNNDVYILGFDNYSQQRKLWKNGTPAPINLPVYAIAVNGPDVYLAGSSDSIATYWKNGVPVTLPGSKPANISAIIFDGGTLYAAGNTSSTPNSTVPTCWHNSLEVTLPAATSFPYPTCVAGHGNEVYVAGNNISGAVYWDNGKEVQLTARKNGSLAPQGAALGIAVVPH